MSMQIRYPYSRTGLTTCPACRQGSLEGASVIESHSADGSPVRWHRVVCFRCGHTLLFDIDIARRDGWWTGDRQGVDELPPAGLE
jgi:hypothetical protein